MTSRLTLTAYAGAGLAALLLGATLALTQRNASGPAVQNATIYQTPRPLPALALVDDRGQPFNPERLRGRWAWLFFGFTHCPDVCPMTLRMLARARGLVPDGDAPSVYLISVDPERDGGDELGRYVRHFDTSFRGVTGDVEAIDAVTRALYVSRAKVPLAGGGYTVDHSAAVFLVSPEAAVVAVSTPPHAANTLAADFLAIRKLQR